MPPRLQPITRHRALVALVDLGQPRAQPVDDPPVGPKFDPRLQPWVQ